MDRRRLTLTLAAIALWGLALAWLAWRVSLFSTAFAAMGVEPPHATVALFALAAWLQRLTGLVGSALVLAGAAAAPLSLTRPRAVDLAVGCSLVALILALVGAELVCWIPAPRPRAADELSPCFNSLVQHVWGPGILILDVVALGGAVLTIAWTVAAVRTLAAPMSPSASTEAGRSLFVAAPFVIALHVLGGSWLAKLQLDSFGFPLLHRDAAALTATGAVVLAAALARLSLRGRVDVEPRDAEDLARAQP